MDHPNTGRRVEPKARPASSQAGHQRSAGHKRRRGAGHTAVTVLKVLGTLCLVGILTIQDAVQAQRDGLSIGDVVRREVQTTSPNALVSDIMPLAAEAVYPIAVVDGDGQLKGIVTKASVLASLI